MADLNWSIQAGASASVNLMTTNASTGNPSDIKDDDTGTYRMDGTGSPPSAPWCLTEFEHIVNFGQTVKEITKVELVAATDVYIRGGIIDLYVYLYYGSSWNKVYTIYNNGNEVFSKTTFTKTGSWSNVSKIKVYVYGEASAGPYLPEHVALEDYELRAWGPNLLDKGIRVYNGSSVIKIGVKALSGHKLRFYDGSTTYGIPLLSTSDSNASELRIYDGTTVKALPKVD